MVATSFPCPYGSQHQETLTPRGSKQEVQPVERIVIAPLQVIDQQQEWLRRQAECGTQRLVKMKALPALRERLWSGNFGIFTRISGSKGRRSAHCGFGKHPPAAPK